MNDQDALEFYRNEFPQALLDRDSARNDLKKCHGTLRECELEILALRKRNELLAAKVEVMDLFAQVLHTKPAERSCPASPDIVFQIVKRLEGM